jgi:hypothetical protein
VGLKIRSWDAIKDLGINEHFRLACNNAKNSTLPGSYSIGQAQRPWAKVARRRWAHKREILLFLKANFS